MLTDYADFVRAGFSEAFLDKLVEDFKEATDDVVKLIAEYHRLGFSVAWVEDLVTTAGPTGMKFMQDLLGQFAGASHPAMLAARENEHAKVQAAAPGDRPFLKWLAANGPQVMAIVLKLLGLGFPLAPEPHPAE